MTKRYFKMCIECVLGYWLAMNELYSLFTLGEVNVALSLPKPMKHRILGYVPFQYFVKPPMLEHDPI